MLMNSQITAMNLGFPLTNTESTAQTGKAEKTSSFKDFLNSSNIKAGEGMRNNPVGNLASQKADNTKENTVDDTVRQKTFREFEKDMKVDTRKAMIQGKKDSDSEYDTSVDTEKPEADMSEVDKSGIILNCLAQVMGVKTDELVKLLEAAGIKPEELSSLSESDTLETKLAQVFGLDGKAEKTLGKILDLIDSQVEEAISKVLQDETGKKTELVKLDEINLKVVLSKENSANTTTSETTTPEAAISSDLMLKFKLKLKEMGEKLEENETVLMEEISVKIHPVLKNASAMLKASLKPVDTGAASNLNMEAEESAEVETIAVEESGLNLKETEQTSDSEALMPQQTSVKPESQEILQNIGNATVQIQSKDPEINVENIKMKAPVPDSEILHQVIEKAKVVITADKSEMVMNLQPDSLGKLSLKVVTEHGMVMAKFVAESQQVKQVLESNMQLLKDSLEKQGLNVQGFSVSVRQESQNNRSDYNRPGENRRMGSTVQTSGSNRIYVDAADFERLQRINPYRQEGNTINLTA